MLESHRKSDKSRGDPCSLRRAVTDRSSPHRCRLRRQRLKPTEAHRARGKAHGIYKAIASIEPAPKFKAQQSPKSSGHLPQGEAHAGDERTNQGNEHGPLLGASPDARQCAWHSDFAAGRAAPKFLAPASAATRQTGQRRRPTRRDSARFAQPMPSFQQSRPPSDRDGRRGIWLHCVQPGRLRDESAAG